MSWWRRLFKAKEKTKLDGIEGRELSTLYSLDGQRSAAIVQFSDGGIYLDECEWIEGTTFRNRHAGRLVGPFASPDEAKSFIITTAWFRGS